MKSHSNFFLLNRLLKKYAFLNSFSRHSLTQKGKKTLVLDLDETLIHSSKSVLPFYDFKITFQKKPKATLVYVVVRPFLAQFLEIMEQFYEIVVFTSGIKYVLLPF